MAGVTDTQPDAERVQLALLRTASVAQRIRLVRTLSDTALQLSWRALRRAHPGATEDELAVAFVALHYGRPLAEAVRRYLQAQHA